MMELNVTLEFACGECEQNVTVTVQCQGEALTQGGREARAAVNVPCPNCGLVNNLLFDACGRVHTVRLRPSIRSFAEPSIN
jgi:hypothetical protein